MIVITTVDQVQYFNVALFLSTQYSYLSHLILALRKK